MNKIMKFGVLPGEMMISPRSSDERWDIDKMISIIATAIGHDFEDARKPDEYRGSVCVKRNDHQWKENRWDST